MKSIFLSLLAALIAIRAFVSIRRPRKSKQPARRSMALTVMGRTRPWLFLVMESEKYLAEWKAEGLHISLLREPVKPSGQPYCLDVSGRTKRYSFTVWPLHPDLVAWEEMLDDDLKIDELVYSIDASIERQLIARGIGPWTEALLLGDEVMKRSYEWGKS
jgi:hypothetical protein